MTRIAAVLVLLTLTLGCTELAPTPARPPAGVWAPLVCDVPEVLVWQVAGGPRTTERAALALIDAPPEDVLVRVLRPERDPCASLEPGTCGVLHDARLSPDGRYRYYAPGSDVVTGLDDGTTRVLCSVTVASEGRGATTQVFARGGEYLVR